ncbi:MAG: phosphotriesterase [Actinobacteria bacterium]|nr:phosphotriesterase [Actinomycetota bacterium]
MAQIPVATGASVDSASLGATLMHEHVFVRTPDVAWDWDSGWGDTEARVADAIARLNDLKAAGVDTIVDLTVPGNGRDAPLLARIAGETALNIVVATGWYTYESLPPSFHWRSLLGGGTEAVLTEWFVRDIEEGIGDTGVRAAILKCATDEAGLTRDVEAILRAVARAHRRTGVPISTHTHPASRNGLDQQRVFIEEGVDLTRVVIGHSGDTTDLDYLEELIANGSLIGMDRFGVEATMSFDERVGVVADLCARGHASKMVLSHDASCFIDWFDEEMLKASTPNWHYLHITKDVVPALKERGVTDEQVNEMLVDNPRRIFEQQGAY